MHFQSGLYTWSGVSLLQSHLRVRQGSWWMAGHDGHFLFTWPSGYFLCGGGDDSGVLRQLISNCKLYKFLFWKHHYIELSAPKKLNIYRVYIYICFGSICPCPWYSPIQHLSHASIEVRLAARMNGLAEKRSRVEKVHSSCILCTVVSRNLRKAKGRFLPVLDLLHPVRWCEEAWRFRYTRKWMRTWEPIKLRNLCIPRKIDRMERLFLNLGSSYMLLLLWKNTLGWHPGFFEFECILVGT